MGLVGEVITPGIVAAVLVEAGRGRRQQHHLTGLGQCPGPLDGPHHVATVLKVKAGGAEGGGHGGVVGADEEDFLDLMALDFPGQQVEILALADAAGDEIDRRLQASQGGGGAAGPEALPRPAPP